MLRNQHRRVAAILAAVGAGALVLTGCSGGGGSTDSTDPYAAPEAEGGPFSAFPGASLTLSRWAGDPWTSGQQAAAEEWNEATSGELTIDAIPYENLRDKQALALSSGSDFDIVYVHPSWFGEFAEAGYLAPIDDYLADADRNPDGFSAASYLPGVLEQGALDGTQYCLPDFVSTIVLGYRTDLFEAAGLDAPETLDDVLAAAAQLDGVDGVSGIIMPGKRTGAVADILSTMITAQGNWWFDADGGNTLDAEAAERAIQFYVDAAAYAPEGLLNFHFDESTAGAAQGTAAMVIGTTPSLAALEDPSKSSTVGKWGYVPLAFEAGEPGGELIYWNWCIAAQSENPDAAYSFLQWYTGAEQQAKVAIAAGTAGATEDFYDNQEVLDKLPFLTAMNEALSNSNPQPSLASWGQVQDQIELALQEAILGDKTPAQAAEAMHTAVDALSE